MGNYENVFPRKLPPKLSKAQSNIPNLQNVRDHLLFSFEENLLNGEEFIHLYNINTLIFMKIFKKNTTMSILIRNLFFFFFLFKGYIHCNKIKNDQI